MRTMRFHSAVLTVIASSIVAIVLLVRPGVGAPPERPRIRGGGESSAGLKVYPTKYYIIHTDLDTDDVKEAIIRMTKMAEEYHERTRGFSGEIRQRLPFYLYRNESEYFDAGGLPGSAGVFTGDRLLAVAGERTTLGTWHVVQHEGFHQFAAAVIRGQRPAWLNEGIAEYFGESIFTGDGFVTGVIPPSRLRRVQDALRDGKYKSIQRMMTLSQEAWNRDLTGDNYDQAWSMVHFLAHGENGKYQQPFVSFMQALGRGIPWVNAWRQNFGDATGFEDRWRDWWLGLGENPTANLYAQAMTATFTSYYARATLQKQHFGSFSDFLDAAKDEHVKTGESIDDWLPPSLLKRFAEAADRANLTVTLGVSKSHTPQVTVVLADQTQFVGNSDIRRSHVARVWVETDDTPAVIERAKGLIEQGKKNEARSILQQALKAHPESASANAARELIKQTRTKE